MVQSRKGIWTGLPFVTVGMIIAHEVLSFFELYYFNIPIPIGVVAIISGFVFVVQCLSETHWIRQFGLRSFVLIILTSSVILLLNMKIKPELIASQGFGSYGWPVSFIGLSSEVEIYFPPLVCNTIYWINLLAAVLISDKKLSSLCFKK